MMWLSGLVERFGSQARRLALLGGWIRPPVRCSAIPLGEKSAPHGVIVGPDAAPWFTDGGQNAIVRVDPATKAVKVRPLPPERMPYTNLNTAAFDGKGRRIWFTGQNGIYGRLDPKTGDMKVWDAPEGRGPYGTGTPSGDIWFVSLAGSYLANVDLEGGAATVYEPPTKDQGARRVWSDSKGRLWISEWNSGNDKQQLEPMLAKINALPEDLGKANVTACLAASLEPLLALARDAHPPSLSERFANTLPVPENPTPVEAMAHRLRTPEGKQLYALRKHTPEPVFGIIKSVLGFRQFLLRGRDKVKGEWTLITMAWNMKRMFALKAA